MSSIRETRAVTGPTNAVNVVACDIVVSGIFVGNWQFQVMLNGDWLTVAAGMDVGGAFLDVKFAEARQVRFNVTAITSGTIAFNLEGHIYRDHD